MSHKSPLILPPFVAPLGMVSVTASIEIIVAPRITVADVPRSRSMSVPANDNYKKGWDTAFKPLIEKVTS